MNLHGLIPLVMALSMAACISPAPDPKVDDTPTFGRATVLADEAFEFLLEDHQLVFNGTYPDAHIDIHYLPEAELAKAMMADSVRAVFSAFLPGGDQLAYFRTRSLSAWSEPVAIDAVAVLVSPDNPASQVTIGQLRDMLTGVLTTWPGTDVPVRILFDKQGSGVPRTLVDSLLDGRAEKLTGAGAVNGTGELVQRVAANPGTVGFLSFAVISDLDDARCRALRAPVRLLPVAASDTSAAHSPNQGTLKDGSYPLRRNLMMMVIEGKSGLGTGFASFVAGHKGQRIVLKQGLAPVRTPERDVEIVHPR